MAARGGLMRSRWKVIGIALAALLCASYTWAQQAAGISGVVRDSSNAVLPGVTVEAASAALIERTRTVTTDGEGRYSIVDLRPGTYTMTFSLPGFATTQADVGGTRDTWSAQGAYTFFHGKTGTRASYDGFRNQYFIGAASGVGYITDQGNIQEMQLETTGMGAESGSGSTSLNAI